MVREINLNHICKIEGHAHLNLKIEHNKVIQCHLKASEGARFFEALVLGKQVKDVQEIVSRICGICSSAHTVASIQALEEALNIKPTRQQKFIRELLMIGERIRSHATHLYFLALPDYYNKASALQLGPEHKEKINDAISLITLGNKIVEVFGGREIHPFLDIKEELPQTSLQGILNQLKQSKPKIIQTINLFANLQYKKFERKTDYLCLKDDKNYANISGKIVTLSGLINDNNYKRHIKESVKEYATSKFALQNNKPYCVGSIARINNNQATIDNETKTIMQQLNISLPFTNPFHNNIAQALELLIHTNQAIKLIENMPQKEKLHSTVIKSGHGISAVEAPRGTLFHEYKINEHGKVTYCNIITPTVQNLNMMESDIAGLVNQLLEEKTSRKQIVLEVEKLIRSYDPCFSCSTHFLKVNWLEEYNEKTH
ncbi:Ni/Fe hydrogenase subunit alpha [Candidatus Pacearchaeota archaeon]|nr:Ni/Fe hydrogenase subunit alpha [Candidatus Pacearchaeota archaeon]